MTEEKTLVAIENYLKTGAHIGTRFKTGDMQRYIFKQRKDGLKVLDVEIIDSRIRLAAAFLARYDLEKIVVVSKKPYGRTPAKMFAEATGARALTGRFVPGTFTNPLAKEFVEPKVIVVADPNSDEQAISEATKVKAPVIALCSTNNSLKNVDLAVPINNKGRKSLALAFWLLAREALKIKGIIKGNEDFQKSAEDFEYKMQAGEEREGEEGEGGERREDNESYKRRRGKQQRYRQKKR